MKAELKSLRDGIHRYFGNARHTARVYQRHGKVTVDVTYEDFLPESRVLDGIRNLSRPGYLLVVKRECSDSLLADILMFIYGYGKGRYKGSPTFDFASVPLYDLMAEFERENEEKDSPSRKKR